jgi:hypothetical protein
MSEWQPIETHNNCLGVFVCAPKRDAMAAYRDATGVWRVLGSKHNYTKLPFKPTHWMPLPAPPA